MPHRVARPSERTLYWPSAHRTANDAQRRDSSEDVQDPVASGLPCRAHAPDHWLPERAPDAGSQPAGDAESTVRHSWQPPDGHSPSSDADGPTQGGTLVIGVLEEPDMLNFSLAHRRVSMWVLGCLTARLIRVRHDTSLDPQILAELPTRENGGVSPDGRTYTLRFRAGLRWSDGDPLDGRDLLFTWRLLTDPAYPTTSRAGSELLQSIELSNDSLTATIRLERPAASFVETVLVGIGERPSGFLLPAHALEGLTSPEIVDSDYGALGHLSSGPFVVVDWQPGEHLVLERNPTTRGARCSSTASCSAFSRASEKR